MSNTKNPIYELIEQARQAERKGKACVSDIHLIKDSEPRLRIDGRNRRNDGGDRISNQDIDEFVNKVGVEQLAELATNKCFTTSFHTLETGSCRVHVQHTHRGLKLVIRLLHDRVPVFDTLGLPKQIRDFAELPNGLVLVTGGTGSGKSTTLASLIDHINKTKEGAICTVEDPIEYLHESQTSDVVQMLIGRDTPSFSKGIESILRMDPDVILVGEIRDQATALACLQAAESGHLVFASLHDNSAEETVSRFINMFPGEMQNQVRIGLATSLRAVIAQRLVKKVGGTGRLAITEIMKLNTAIKANIRDLKEHQIYATIDAGEREGMITLEKSLIRAVQSGLITRDEALGAANQKEKIEQSLKAVA
jgi:twitching motility protein PilT